MGDNEILSENVGARLPMADTVFGKIVAGKIPVKGLLRMTRCWFLDINP